MRHRQLTERSNEQTIRTAEWLEKNGKPFWLRYVLVPGYSSFEEDIRALGEHFKNYHMIQRVEIQTERNKRKYFRTIGNSQNVIW